jgi:hypothetical protein
VRLLGAGVHNLEEPGGPNSAQDDDTMQLRFEE